MQPQVLELSRQEYIKYIEFKNDSSLGVEKLRYFKEFNVTGVFSSKEFRYSWDRITWSNWNTLTQGNIVSINFRDRPAFWIEVRYNRPTVIAGNIERFYIAFDSLSPAPGPVPDASIDADYLQGEPGAYYLDRSNHYGPYTGLNILNKPDGSTVGVYDSSVSTEYGTTFYFKRIGGRDGISVYEDPFSKIIVDGSSLSTGISRLDSSVSNLYSIVSFLDSSISYLIRWNTSIDASIVEIDSDIQNLITWNTTLDASIDRIDSSIDNILGWLTSLDASIIDINLAINGIDSSIAEIIGWNNSLDASIIRIDASIEDLYSREVSIGVVNVGGGSAGSFAGFDSSNSIRLRTFVSGSPQAVVAEVGDQIVITLDSSYSGEVNYGVNIGSGDASIYAGKSGEALEFREIKGIGSVVVSTSDNLILIETSAGSGTYDTSLDPNLEMPTSVGGIPIGTKVSDLSGDTFIQLFDNLLFPTVNPTYDPPYNSFGDNVAGLQVIGDIIDITFTATFNRGQILINSVFQNYRSGLPNTYTYSGTGITGSVSSTLLTDSSILTGYEVIQGTQSWTNTVSFDEGPQPLDNKGNPYDGPLPAGTTSSKTVSFEGVYPLFGTTSDISNPNTQQPLVSMLSGNNIVFSMVPESGGYKQSFDIPDIWNSARPLQGIETYNTVSTSWDYEGGSPSSSLLAWDISLITQVIEGNSISYTRYTFNGEDRSSIQIRLKF